MNCRFTRPKTYSICVWEEIFSSLCFENFDLWDALSPQPKVRKSSNWMSARFSAHLFPLKLFSNFSTLFSTISPERAMGKIWNQVHYFFLLSLPLFQKKPLLFYFLVHGCLYIYGVMSINLVGSFAFFFFGRWFESGGGPGAVRLSGYRA